MIISEIKQLLVAFRFTIFNTTVNNLLAKEKDIVVEFLQVENGQFVLSLDKALLVIAAMESNSMEVSYKNGRSGISSLKWNRYFSSTKRFDSDRPRPFLIQFQLRTYDIFVS